VTWPLRKVDVRLPGKENYNSHGARPVHLIITMIKWIRTSRLSMKNSLSDLAQRDQPPVVEHLLSLSASGYRVQGSGYRVQGSGLRVKDEGLRVKG